MQVTNWSGLMSVRFGSNGTLYCNTVKYNYKQTRNLVADNGYTYNHWNFGACELGLSDYEFPFEYFMIFPAGNNLYMSTQPMPTPIANHKYYGGLLWMTVGSTYSIADGRFEWYYTDGDTNNNLTFGLTLVILNSNNDFCHLYIHN
jgi:hypothetical protein